MAPTENLLGLINEFSEAFADPELPIALPPKPVIAKLKIQAEFPAIKELDDLVTNFDLSKANAKLCNEYLASINNDSKLVRMAANFLGQLARLYELKQCSNVAPSESKAIAQPMLQLDETYAREGSLDCPSGMCPLDH
jgi:hypothetical protein